MNNVMTTARLSKAVRMYNNGPEFLLGMTVEFSGNGVILTGCVEPEVWLRHFGLERAVKAQIVGKAYTTSNLNSGWAPIAVTNKVVEEPAAEAGMDYGEPWRPKFNILRENLTSKASFVAFLLNHGVVGEYGIMAYSLDAMWDLVEDDGCVTIVNDVYDVDAIRVEGNDCNPESDDLWKVIVVKK